MKQKGNCTGIWHSHQRQRQRSMYGVGIKHTSPAFPNKKNIELIVLIALTATDRSASLVQHLCGPKEEESLQMTAEFEKSAVEEPPCIHISLLQANPPNGSLFSALCRKVQNSMRPIGLIFDSFIHSRLDDGKHHSFPRLCRKYLR